jgi:DDE superfamily endonuclease
VCFLSATSEGKAHDKSLADLAGYTLPSGSCLYQDMGFQGFVLAGVTIVQPKKKPRRGELTPSEQATNRRISSIRVRIEHAIGGVKRYRIVKDKIRLLKDGIRDTIMETCCGLHNFRLQYRPWHYAP